MADKEKIVLLTRLAIYDTRMSESDKKINNYFLHDYIYAKNVRTRFFAFIGAAIVVLFYVLYRIFVEKTDIFTLDYVRELTVIAAFVVFVLVFYTAVGGLQAAFQYSASQKRINAYLDVLKKTGEMETDDRSPGERAKVRDNGRDSIYTSGNYKRY